MSHTRGPRFNSQGLLLLVQDPPTSGILSYRHREGVTILVIDIFFVCPHFVTLLYVCGISSHTAVFVGKRKIT